MESKTIHENSLRKLREEKGLTQNDLARMSGISANRISDTETGRRNMVNISLGTAIKLADALEIIDLRKLL